MLATALVLLSCSLGVGEVPGDVVDDTRGPDPSGVWVSDIGRLVLMRAGDSLSFSYLAVGFLVIELRGAALFDDGFETGDTLRWAQAVP
jgi:hypothetical protein